MEVREAKQVLNFTTSEQPTAEEVLDRFHKYFVANDPATGGSLYLQSKIFNAKDAMLMEMDFNPDEFKFDAAGNRVADEDDAEGAEDAATSGNGDAAEASDDEDAKRKSSD